MCDHAGHQSTGWRGWIDLPDPKPATASSAPWLDLSHPLHAGMPHASIFPAPRFERIRSMPGYPMNVAEMQMAVHCGTHVDAPIHFFEDGPDFASIPLDRLMWPGVVLDIPGDECLRVDAAMLDALGAMIEPGDIVALHTGWAAHAGTSLYSRHPWLTEDAARWLVDRRIKLLACDTPSADLPIPERKAGFDWPAHHVLLGHGVLIGEHLTGHAALAGKRAEFIFNALAIRGSDGAPARVLARAVAD